MVVPKFLPSYNDLVINTFFKPYKLEKSKQNVIIWNGDVTSGIVLKSGSEQLKSSHGYHFHDTKYGFYMMKLQLVGLSLFKKAQKFDCHFYYRSN